MDAQEMNTENNPLSLGQKLRVARETQQLSLEEVAQRLNLKKDWVRSLEQDEYHFISPTYLKGYLRVYSRLLKIQDEIHELPHFEVNVSNYFAYPQIMYKKQFSASNKSMKWVTYSIIFILVLLVVKWWNADVVTPSNIHLAPVSLNNIEYVPARENILSSGTNIAKK